MGFPARLRFGVFEVDLQSGELRKQGVKLKLQAQPFQILAALLERSGEIVTREDLRQRLGASDAFGDFDHLVNKAVNKIRDVLGDSASSPLFVETLPRRGYRFLVPVEKIDPLGPRRNKRRIAEISVVGAGVLLISTLGLFWWLRSSAVAPRRRALRQLTRDAGLTTDPALSRDGRLLAYASDRGGNGNLDIWVQQLSGGEPGRLTRDPADEREPDFAPDGSQIAFRSEREGGGIYVLATFGGEPRLIAKHGHTPRFSPQGDSIAYWVGKTNEGDPSGSGTGELWIAPTTGGPSRQLRSDFASAVYPVWSPDGEHILFRGTHNYRTGEKEELVFDWWITTRDGTSLVRTGINKAFTEVQASFETAEHGVSNFYQVVPSDWSGDRILFSARVGDSTNLWQVRLSSKGEIRGLPERMMLGADIQVAPSVDNAGHVVFSSLSHRATVWSLPMNGNTGSVFGPPVRPTSGAGPDIGPSISEDGRTLAYTTIRTGKPQLITKDLTRDQERLFTESGNGGSRISRDGLQLAYAVQNGDQTSLYVMNANGGGAKKICDACARYWDWSSDGKKVVYVAADHPPWRLGVYDSESHHTSYVLPDSEYRIYEPRFSPDGRWIAFNARLAPERTQGFVIDFLHASAVRKSDWIPVNEGRFWNEQPEWAPSGRLVYFQSNRDGFACIWAQHIDGLTKRTVGLPFGVYHSHIASLTLEDFTAPARDKMILSLEENAANIWMTELE